MTSPPPWGPDPATGPLAVTPVPQRRRYVTTGLAVLALMAATAAVTYAVTVWATTPPAADVEPGQAAPAEPNSDPAEATAAKDAICEVLLQTTRGSTGRGGVVTDGELNLPKVVRILGSAISVQRATTPALPPEFASLADTYVDRKLQLANAALANEPIDDLVRLNHAGNDATRALADACGLPY